MHDLSGLALCIGGPAMVQALRPSDEELVKRYSPELKKRSQEQGTAKEQEFDDYVKKLKEWSKSDKSSMFADGNMVSLVLLWNRWANTSITSSLVCREGRSGCEASYHRCAAPSRKGGGSGTTGGDAQGDARREIMAIKAWRLCYSICQLQPLL